MSFFKYSTEKVVYNHLKNGFVHKDQRDSNNKDKTILSF